METAAKASSSDVTVSTVATFVQPPKATGVRVSEHHLPWLFITSFRYSYNRSSYAPLACLDLLQTYRTKLDTNTIRILQQELQEHLQSDIPVADKATWQQCLELIS